MLSITAVTVFLALLFGCSTQDTGSDLMSQESAVKGLQPGLAKRFLEEMQLINERYKTHVTVYQFNPDQVVLQNLEDAPDQAQAEFMQVVHKYESMVPGMKGKAGAPGAAGAVGAPGSSSFAQKEEILQGQDDKTLQKSTSAAQTADGDDMFDENDEEDEDDEDDGEDDDHRDSSLKSDSMVEEEEEEGDEDDEEEEKHQKAKEHKTQKQRDEDDKNDDEGDEDEEQDEDDEKDQEDDQDAEDGSKSSKNSESMTQEEEADEDEERRDVGEDDESDYEEDHDYEEEHGNQTKKQWHWGEVNDSSVGSASLVHRGKARDEHRRRGVSDLPFPTPSVEEAVSTATQTTTGKYPLGYIGPGGGAVQPTYHDKYAVQPDIGARKMKTRWSFDHPVQWHENAFDSKPGKCDGRRRISRRRAVCSQSHRRRRDHRRRRRHHRRRSHEYRRRRRRVHRRRRVNRDKKHRRRSHRRRLDRGDPKAMQGLAKRAAKRAGGNGEMTDNEKRAGGNEGGESSLEQITQATISSSTRDDLGPTSTLRQEESRPKSVSINAAGKTDQEIGMMRRHNLAN